MDYLLGKGLKLIAKNYLARCGEIDLIMQDGATLVFFEIRYRADNQYMNALETIDSKKRTHIIHATQHYLQTHRDESEKICRFDVMIIFGHADNPDRKSVV